MLDVCVCVCVNVCSEVLGPLAPARTALLFACAGVRVCMCVCVCACVRVLPPGEGWGAKLCVCVWGKMTPGRRSLGTLCVVGLERGRLA